MYGTEAMLRSSRQFGKFEDTFFLYRRPFRMFRFLFTCSSERMVSSRGELDSMKVYGQIAEISIERKYNR
jgi:hypothetical protein